MRLAVQLKPKAKKQLQDCVELVDAFARLEFNKNIPTKFAFVKDWTNDVLCECLKSARHQRKADTVFLTTKKSSLGLLVENVATLDKIIQAGKNYSIVEQELARNRED